MTTNEFPRYANVALRDYDDRAARYLAVARALSIPDDIAYLIADLALDLDTIKNAEPNLNLEHSPENDALLLLAQASYWGDDDYDDFRHELRMAIGGDLADPDYDDDI